MKGPKRQKQTLEQNEKDSPSSVGLCQRHEPQHSHDVKVSPARQELKGGKGKPHISGGTLRHPRKKKRKKEGSDLASYDNNTTNRKADVETKLDRQRKKKRKKNKTRVHTYHT